jgi:hypothetical protein
MKVIKYVAFMSIVAVIALNGCGRDFSSTSNSNFELIDYHPKNEKLAKFNQDLGNITDESTAEKTIVEFADYVNSRAQINCNYKSNKSISTMSSKIISKLAEIESKKRIAKSKGLSVKEAGPEITPKKVAESMNALINQGTQEAVNEQGVSIIQTEIRKELPNLAIDNSNQMTPLEAMVIGYVMYSNDDGCATPESVALNVDQEKTEEFMEKIIE